MVSSSIFWIEELGTFDAPAFKFFDLGGEMHFGLGEQELEGTVLASPFGGSKMARKYCKLVDKVSNRVQGGMSHNCVEWH